MVESKAIVINPNDCFPKKCKKCNSHPEIWWNIPIIPQMAILGFFGTEHDSKGYVRMVCKCSSLIQPEYNTPLFELIKLWNNGKRSSYPGKKNVKNKSL